MKIATIVGARPQFIKAATISRQLPLLGVSEIIIHTGQHFDAKMSEIFFSEMEIPQPHYNLDIHGLTHGAMTGRMMEGIEKILIDENPDLVLVYGDTNSTLAGALAAKKAGFKLAHVEAGLRSFNMAMPEEINRILTDRISDYLFCPTDTAIANLRDEGFDLFENEVIKTGDVMYDAALFYLEKAKKKSTVIAKMKLSADSYFLATIHRQENTDRPDILREIVGGLNLLANKQRVIVPLHPRTQNKIAEFSLHPEFEIIDPVGYFDMLMLLSHAQLVITDSGGLQKEAYFFGKKCLVMREQTEWVELIRLGNHLLCPPNAIVMQENVDRLIHSKGEKAVDGLYGDGHSAKKIAEIIATV